jgi:circadian clock protein KaiC
MHLVAIYKLAKKFKPKLVVIDPVTNLTAVGSVNDVKSMLIRLVDFFQGEGITAVFTALTYDKAAVTDQIDERISSLMDNWIVLSDHETLGERNRGITVIKARGTNHSNRVREFIMTNGGLELVDVYMGADGALTGSARRRQQESEKIINKEKNREELIGSRQNRNSGNGRKN